MVTSFDSVIVGVDGTDQAKDALMLGRLLGALGSRTILVAHVIGASRRTSPKLMITSKSGETSCAVCSTP